MAFKDTDGDITVLRHIRGHPIATGLWLGNLGCDELSIDFGLLNVLDSIGPVTQVLGE